MKNLNILSLLVVVALLFAVQPASAVVSVKNSQESTSASVSKKELKKQERMEKVMTKIQKKLDKWEKKVIDRNDDVGKWLWWAIFAGLGYRFHPLLQLLAGCWVMVHSQPALVCRQYLFPHLAAEVSGNSLIFI
ncbi:MAG: hypothetical protein IPL49_05945 [Saprospirales bacterium]|nr:hypothetical protein [Saprospirales bacterium]